jgi:spore germination cell wall hydrolase CwlJ-like protein
MPIVTPDYSKLWEGYSKEGQVAEDAAPPAAAPRVEAPVEAPRAPAALPEVESKDGRLGAADLERMFGPSTPKAEGATVDLGTPSVVKKTTVVPTKAPTRFVQNVTPAHQTKERTLGEALSESKESIVPSVQEAFKTYGHALAPWNWDETLTGLKHLAQGAVSKVTGASVGQTLEEQKKNEAMASALAENYANYFDKQKLYEKIATDPASVLMDMSMLLTGGSSLVAKGAGATSKLGKVASTVGKAAEYIDPITGTIKAGTTLAKGATAPVRAAAAGTSGLSMDMQKIIREAASSDDPAMRDTYQRFAKGDGTPEEFLQTTQDAIRQLEKEKIEGFKTTKANLFNRRIDFSKINNDVQAFRNEINKGSPSGYSKAKEAIDEADDMILDLINDPSRHTLEHVDVLKGQIYDLKNKFSGNPKAADYLDKIYHSISDTLGSPALGGSKEYAELMKEAQLGMKYIQNAQKQLGAGRNAAATSALMKALKSTKTYGGKSLLDDVSRVDPSIKYMLAGAASNPAHGGMMRNISDLLIFGGLGSLVNPMYFAGLAGASPKVVANANYYGAKAADLAKASGKPAYYAGRLEELDSAAGQKPLPNNVSPADVDAMVRTVIGEAGGESPEGQAAVAHVIMNRLKKGGFGGESIKDVVTAPHQFEAVSRGIADKIDKNSKQYQEVLNNIVLPLLRGELQDVTGGATNFINKALQTQRGMQIPEWASGEGQQIGRHTFYGTEGQADGGRIERASGGKVGKSIDHLVGRLMKMAKDAKKVSDKRTEPLLNAPDEAIVKALDIAQQAI